jgi:hypothetical protein
MIKYTERINCKVNIFEILSGYQYSSSFTCSVAYFIFYIECTDGKWGINCQYDCGKCLFSPCNRVNGDCTGGCVAGYIRTTKCLTGNYLKLFSGFL